ncbi:MAG TPA: hypothetical protein VGJ20_23700 [Xanthobacteraceae bacterium]
MTAVTNHIVWRANQVIDRMSLRDERLAEARRRLDALPKRLVGKIVVRRNTSKEDMDEKTEQAFLEAITPGHPTNPFRKEAQSGPQPGAVAAIPRWSAPVRSADFDWPSPASQHRPHLRFRATRKGSSRGEYAR